MDLYYDVFRENEKLREDLDNLVNENEKLKAEIEEYKISSRIVMLPKDFYDDDFKPHLGNVSLGSNLELRTDFDYIYNENAKLKIENEKLKAEIEKMNEPIDRPSLNYEAEYTSLIIQNEKLEDENKDLRQALVNMALKL
jgi:regulator of replication initiation timing